MGIAGMRNFNLTVTMEKAGIEPASGELAPGFAVGRPAVLGNQVMVGTRTTGQPLAGTPYFQYLMYLDLGAPVRSSILKSHLAFPMVEDIHDISWIHPELVLVTTGAGSMHLVAVRPGTHELKHHGILPAIHSQPVREVAMNPNNCAQFASGGYDKTLCLVDLERPEFLQPIKVEGIIGSVSWPVWNRSVCPSVTLDNGTFLIYDARTSPVGAPAFSATMGKKELFAHCRYTDHNVLLGFGDGVVQHIDVRVTDRILGSFQDPRVTAIGGLEYQAESNRLLVSGLSDLTVWDVNPASHEASVRCHFHSDSSSSRDLNTHSGVFHGNHVVATMDAGLVAEMDLPERAEEGKEPLP